MKVLLIAVFLNCFTLGLLKVENRKVKTTTPAASNSTSPASQPPIYPNMTILNNGTIIGTNSSENGTDRRWMGLVGMGGIGGDMFPGGMNPMLGGMNPMLPGQGPMMPPPFNPNGIGGLGIHSCRDWCLSAGGVPYCCDGHDIMSLRCPADRDVCPFPNRSFGSPRMCQFHTQCLPMELCCTDVCLPSRVCKPAQ